MIGVRVKVRLGHSPKPILNQYLSHPAWMCTLALILAPILTLSL